MWKYCRTTWLFGAFWGCRLSFLVCELNAVLLTALSNWCRCCSSLHSFVSIVFCLIQKLLRIQSTNQMYFWYVCCMHLLCSTGLVFINLQTDTCGSAKATSICFIESQILWMGSLFQAKLFQTRFILMVTFIYVIEDSFIDMAHCAVSVLVKL